MAYDTQLADRIRAVVHQEQGLTQRSMFGGQAFLISGNMAVAAGNQGGLLLRVKSHTSSLVQETGATRFRMRGREMDGWLHLTDAAIATDEHLRHWVSHGVAYARSLPAK